MFAYGTDGENIEHFLLCCHFYNSQRLELFESLQKVDVSFLSLSAKHQVYRYEKYRNFT